MRGGERASLEELWLGLATIAALTIPPCGSVAIDDVSRRTSDCLAFATNTNERAFPFLVSKASGACKGDLEVNSSVAKSHMNTAD